MFMFSKAKEETMPELEEMMWREAVHTDSPDKKVDIEFVYEATRAKKVYLAGSFNRWDPHALPMKKNKLGQWKATVSLLPGRYEYKFFADGAWVTDPRCPEVVVNDMGSTNCVISVVAKMAA
jgi:1,4-alpha-glucan branching enzyme